MAMSIARRLMRRFQMPKATPTKPSRRPFRQPIQELESRVMPTGDIQVLIWHDVNGNGVKDGGDDGIPDRTVYLDTNHSGSFDAGDLSQITDYNGDAFFLGLPAGDYTVVDLLPSGWAPSAGMSSVQDIELIDTEQPEVKMGSYEPQVGTINGSVWNDLNGDGIHTAGEPGLPNWTVFLDANTNGTFDAGELSRLTSATGAYSFAPVASGVYSVAEVVPTGGWLASPGYATSKTVTVPLAAIVTANFSNYVPTPGKVSGTVYQDNNGNGAINGSDTGVSGITVYADLNKSGTSDAGEPSAVTSATGTYTISGIPGGSVQTIREVMPLGWSPASGWDTSKDVNVNYGATTSLNFLNFFTAPASIGGTVWNDANADSLHNAGETGQAGVTLFIDTNTNGTLDAGETFATTDTNGAYSLGAVLPGTYSVTEVLPSGWQTSPGFSVSKSITVSAGVGSLVPFSNYLPAVGSIAGSVWSDLDNNGTRGVSEGGVANWQVYLDLNSDGALSFGEPTTLTSITGTFTFSNVDRGTYALREFTKAAWLPTNPTTGVRSVTVLNGQNVTGADFGNYAPQNSTISGTVYFDKNHDGVRTADERGIAGVTVYLDLNTNGSLDAGEPSMASSKDLFYTPSSNETGNYAFSHLAPGTYHVREVLPVDQSATPVSELDKVVTIVSIEDHGGINFGNVYRGNEIHGVMFEDINGNHIRDAGEPVVAGAKIYLDTNRNNVRDAGEPGTITGVDGSYSFTNLTPGSYVIRVEGSNDTVGTYPTTTSGTLWPTGVSNPSVGIVTPSSITQSLAQGQTYSTNVSLTLPGTGSITNMVDVFLLFDDTGSFTGNSPIVRAAFPAIISSLQASMPGIDLGFGVGRFEEYGNFAAEYATGRPFILNQPIVSAATAGFSAAIQSALDRTTPGYGGDGPETLIEALYQTATGVGFDGNNNGSTSESGAAGVVSTQLNPGASGDVPAFSSFSTPIGSPVLAPSGNVGGAGFRAGALPIILAATDIGLAYQPRGETSIIGAGGLSLPITSLTQTSRPTTPYNSGAGIQDTITALNALGALVIGLGTNPDLTSDPRQDLSSISRLTGAINRSTATIANGTPTPIAPNDPLYFLIQSGFSTSVVNGVVNAIQNAATSVAMDVTLQASDPRVQITNTPGTVLGLGAGQTANFNVTFTGDGAPRRFDLQFVRAGTNVVLGSIPVVLGTPISGNNYEFEDLEEGEIEIEDDFGHHHRSHVSSLETTAVSGTYTTGQSLPITLNFDTSVTLAGGPMTVALNSGGTLSIAPFSGTTATATYTVAAGETSPSLDVTSFGLAVGATLKDTYGYDATLSLPSTTLPAGLIINPTAPTTVSFISINGGETQRSRIDSITLNFTDPVDAATLSALGAITLTRTTAMNPADVGTLVQSGATGAAGRIAITPVSGFVSSVTLSFNNADGSAVSSGVENGSLADGIWRLAIPSLGYLSPLNDAMLRRLLGDDNNDGTIDGSDLTAFGNAFNTPTAAFDFNNDGTVDGSDLTQFGNHFGTTL